MSINQLPLVCPLSRDQTRNVGMCPNQESNWRPFPCGTTPSQLIHTSQGLLQDLREMRIE